VTYFSDSSAWIGPVLRGAVSAALIVCGLISLSRGGVPARLPHWLMMIAGGLVVIVSFVWDFRNVMEEVCRTRSTGRFFSWAKRWDLPAFSLH